VRVICSPDISPIAAKRGLSRPMNGLDQGWYKNQYLSSVTFSEILAREFA
jgi:hypothetical protein